MTKRMAEFIQNSAPNFCAVYGKGDNYTVTCKSLPVLLQVIAWATAEVGPNGSDAQDFFIADLGKLTYWIKGDGSVIIG